MKFLFKRIIEQLKRSCIQWFLIGIMFVYVYIDDVILHYDISLEKSFYTGLAYWYYIMVGIFNHFFGRHVTIIIMGMGTCIPFIVSSYQYRKQMHRDKWIKMIFEKYNIYATILPIKNKKYEYYISSDCRQITKGNLCIKISKAKNIFPVELMYFSINQSHGNTIRKYVYQVLPELLPISEMPVIISEHKFGDVMLRKEFGKYFSKFIEPL